MIEIENISKHFDDTAALSKSPFEYLKEKYLDCWEPTEPGKARFFG